jgi:hypothetical protein
MKTGDIESIAEAIAKSLQESSKNEVIAFVLTNIDDDDKPLLNEATLIKEFNQLGLNVCNVSYDDENDDDDNSEKIIEVFFYRDQVAVSDARGFKIAQSYYDLKQLIQKKYKEYSQAQEVSNNNAVKLSNNNLLAYQESTNKLSADLKLQISQMENLQKSINDKQISKTGTLREEKTNIGLIKLMLNTFIENSTNLDSDILNQFIGLIDLVNAKKIGLVELKSKTNEVIDNFIEKHAAARSRSGSISTDNTDVNNNSNISKSHSKTTSNKK